MGRLPADWPTTPIGRLRPATASPQRARRTLDTTAALRAIAIVLLVGTHVGLFNVPGGAHLLFGVAGYNFGRFQLTGAPRPARVRRIGRSIGRIALAAAVWIALVHVVTGQYSVANIFLANYVVGSDRHTNHWHFWFIETLVYTLLALLAVLSIPVGDRIERRFPFGLPMALAGLGLITRYNLVPGLYLVHPPAYSRATVLAIFWLFALGWAAAKARTTAARALVTAAVVLTVPGFFGYWPREAVVVAGLTLLVWAPAVPSTGWLNRAAGVVAGSSLYIYLTHWVVWPPVFDVVLRWLPGAYTVASVVALLTALAAGIAYATIVRRAGSLRRQVVALWNRGSASSVDMPVTPALREAD
jgi:hypothetical protein